MGDEKGTTIIETAIDIETKSDGFFPHNEKETDEIIVSQYMDNDSYAVTYSKEDNSIRGWSINVKENGQQLPDVYFKLDRQNILLYKLYKLYKRFLLFSYYDRRYYLHLSIIDLSGKEGRILQLKHAEKISTRDKNSMEFLSNGDLILISSNYELKDYKIYLYSFMNKPTNTTLWEYSQIYDIEIHDILKKHVIDYFVYQTKLFLFSDGLVTQWDLLTMTFEMQYNLISEYVYNMAINKNQTLLALYTGKYNLIDNKIDIYSMETGIHISRYDSNDYIPIEFVTLKDGSEGLLIFNGSYKKYKFLDPFHPFDAVDITDDIISDNENIIITKSNKKIFIKENNVWVTDGLNDDTFQQMLNKTTYHSSIYNLSVFNSIRSMLIDIVNDNVYCDFAKGDKIELTYGELFHFILKRHNEYKVEVKGFSKSQNNNEWKETQNAISFSLGGHDRILSYKQLINQDLALITVRGIRIYTIVEDFLRLRYLWNNEKWVDYSDDNRKINIQEILNNECSEFNGSLTPPNFANFDEDYFKELVKSVINDLVEFSKFGSKMLKIAIKKENVDVVQLIFDKIIELTEKEDYRYMKLLPIISLKLPELYDHHYSSLVVKYILRTSILLDPFSSVKNSTNTSLYAYSNDVYVKKSGFKYSFSSFFKILINHLKIQKQVPTISFIVPFPQICKYQDKDYNSWNEILYKPKSILFCNVDNNNFYKWWNFAAIIDFKWKTFGRFYYWLILLFYTIFFLCFALASTLDHKSISDSYRNILFIVSILLGVIHLIFEIRQCYYWKWKIYFKDPLNLFEIVAYSLPIIASTNWLINGSTSIWIMAISNLLLNFKFLLFFRAFQSFEKYFIIITGVIKIVYPFGIFLFFIILGFAHAFFILLRSMENSSLNQPIFNDDENNPWNLVTKYNSINSDGTINPNPVLIQSPDSNTNLFDWFPTSILAVYLLLIGNSGSLSLWTYQEARTMTLLLVLFTFFMVIYLMNLFIGLLNIAIGDTHTKHEIFLLQKAKIIMEIELFYMLPYQRHKKEWFPDQIYYDIPVDEIRRLISAVDDNKTEFNSPPFLPFISKKLRKLIEIPELYIKDELKQIKDEFQQQINQMNDELKQTKDEIKQSNNEIKQQMKDIQELLHNLVKNSNINNNNDN